MRANGRSFHSLDATSSTEYRFPLMPSVSRLCAIPHPFAAYVDAMWGVAIGVEADVGHDFGTAVGAFGE